MATKTLDEEMLKLVVEKVSEHDVEGWCNQIGLDREVFFEIMTSFALEQLMRNPVFLLTATEEDVTWLLSSFAATFAMGWYARFYQKEDEPEIEI